MSCASALKHAPGFVVGLEATSLPGCEVPKERGIKRVAFGGLSQGGFRIRTWVDVAEQRPSLEPRASSFSTPGVIGKHAELLPSLSGMDIRDMDLRDWLPEDDPGIDEPEPEAARPRALDMPVKGDAGLRRKRGAG